MTAIIWKVVKATTGLAMGRWANGILFNQGFTGFSLRKATIKIDKPCLKDFLRLLSCSLRGTLKN